MTLPQTPRTDLRPTARTDALARPTVMMAAMPSDATRRAVRDALDHGLRGDLAHSQVGIELGQHLQGGLTSDVGDGASPSEIVRAMREECGDDAVAYARLMELIVLAGLDELQVLAGLTGDLEPRPHEAPPTPPRRSVRRRR